MSEFRPSGIITMTTDFGHKGPFAGVMRGVILSRFRDAQIVDIAHDIPAVWPPEAGFWLSRSFTYFPAGTVHMAIVDPGDASDRSILAVEGGGHIFLAPDNGLLDPLISRIASAAVRKIDLSSVGKIGIDQPSITFQGRDIFAPLAAELAAGRLSLGDISSETRDWTPGWLGEPVAGETDVAGVVVSVDAFGNLMTNIDGSLIDDIDSPVALIAGHRLSLMDEYGDARPGEFIGLVNSFGVLEIAKIESNAADGLGVERGAPVRVMSSA